MMSVAIVTSRPRCPRCERAQNACICTWVRALEHRVEVLILQHPLELRQAKGSARLLHLSLRHSQLVTGEVFDAPTLQALLTAPRAKQAILLYPDMPHDQTPGLLAPAPLSSVTLDEPSNLRLIVLDGTWRKSRKMLYLNPALQCLPRLALRDPPASRYRIRRAHRPEQLSTLEATCAALAQLEGGTAQFAALLAAFDGFVAQQSERFL